MRRTAVAIAALGAVGLALGFAHAPRDAAFAYLTAWTFALTIALGALILAMIGHVAGARWILALRPITSAITSALPVLAVLFVPVALAAPVLYAWVDPVEPRLAHKAAYLNLPFWTIRAAGFLLLWATLGELLRRLPADRARAVSAVALPAVGLTLTFGAFDWVMSLTPLWSSTMFGLIYFAGGFVAALALIAAVSPPSSAVGRMVLGFVIFWAYLEFSQGFLIWIADKPEEVPWYIARGAGGWGTVLAGLAIGHFALPVVALLSRAAKQTRVLTVIGGWLVAMHYVDVAWLILPVRDATPALHLVDVAAPLSVIGACVAAIRRAA